MKKILKVVGVALCLVAFTQNSKAQFNVGLDLAMPLGDFGDGFGVGFGGSVGYDHAIGDNMKIGGQVGLLRFGGKEPEVADPEDDYSSSIMLIPILANFKYYFADNTNGSYGVASLGMSMYKYKYEHTYTDQEYNYTTGAITEVKETDNFDVSKTYLTFGVGAGYLINEKIDLSVRYMSVSSEGSASNLINLRAAYNF
jgi:hypothetical protein